MLGGSPMPARIARSTNYPVELCWLLEVHPKVHHDYNSRKELVGIWFLTDVVLLGLILALYESEKISESIPSMWFNAWPGDTLIFRYWYNLSIAYRVSRSRFEWIFATGYCCLHERREYPT
jgi:hypothetical protein